ncbi:MAG TPA: monofunctional biosynthetic peptidoglycan transglycosylase [Syntrophorhabdaceae bacterium]|nr:monofunctional biosynthetic peptidoglycan transglycosylase [Syntrophorhabdaceae bacterium]HPU30338.1 monofunctional biosynthetic peptidoglycan transglycosylase [Syntrophorhabdaceae bacterium]
MGHRKRYSTIFKFLIISIFFSIIAWSGYYLILFDVSYLKTKNPEKTSFMEYREKQWKRQGRKVNVEKRWVPISAISPYLVKAVIIAEDDKFWSHKGFDFEAIQKAIEKDIKEGRLKFGGSTITQQLAKNLFLTPTKNPIRKIKEAIITWKLEKTLSKKRILELYLNVAEWGVGIFGAEAASIRHYGKASLDLDPMEAARLAAVLPNPIKYRIDGKSRYVEKRAQIIYEIMVKRGIVVPEYEDVIKDKSETNDL